MTVHVMSRETFCERFLIDCPVGVGICQKLSLRVTDRKKSTSSSRWSNKYVILQMRMENDQ